MFSTGVVQCCSLAFALPVSSSLKPLKPSNGSQQFRALGSQLDCCASASHLVF